MARAWDFHLEVSSSNLGVGRVGLMGWARPTSLCIVQALWATICTENKHLPLFDLSMPLKCSGISRFFYSCYYGYMCQQRQICSCIPFCICCLCRVHVTQALVRCYLLLKLNKFPCILNYYKFYVIHLSSNVCSFCLVLQELFLSWFMFLDLLGFSALLKLNLHWIREVIPFLVLAVSSQSDCFEWHSCF